MTLTLKLSEEDDRLLTERAAHEGRSQHDIAVEAVHNFLTDRDRRFNEALERGMKEHHELLNRLAE